MIKRDFRYKPEIKKAYHEFLDDRTVNWKKYDSLRNFTDYKIDVDVYKNDKETHKYLLCIVGKNDDFETVHATVRAAINPSLINNWSAVYAHYVITKDDSTFDFKRKLRKCKKHSINSDLAAHNIKHYVSYLKNGVLEGTDLNII